ncbi:DoxX family protein [Nonomuraea turkmeniaca]|uniref:DoxX family protein n=1 Tax=Nonomuraea turkmeniaca TaxID=103838 RepID=A0A5S4F7L0_9ACTN|nr:DoxX family protein [Nonomuraea turkmeniaca]TMR12320.1 DoxX family protein [Nonomuraea turkmeniaca]
MKKVLFDVAALIARVATGVIFIAHGWQKWQSGLGATSEGFRGMGLPLPEVAALYAHVVEFVGGIFLIVGLLVRPVGLLLLINMIGAIAFAHWGKGIMSETGGWELPGALAALGLMFLAVGGGRLGLDALLGKMFRRRKESQAAESDVGVHQRGAGRDEGRTGTGRTGGPLTPSEPGTPETPNVPRQPTAPRSSMSDEDMRDIDALVSDDQPEHRKPPNR